MAHSPSQSAYSQPLDHSDWFIHRRLKSFSQFRDFRWNYWARDTDFLPRVAKLSMCQSGAPRSHPAQQRENLTKNEANTKRKQNKKLELDLSPDNTAQSQLCLRPG